MAQGKRGTLKAPVWGVHALGAHAAAYSAWLLVRGYSVRTLRMHRVYLQYFFRWCEARGLSLPEQITRPILERYQRFLFLHRRRDGESLTWRSQAQRMRCLQGYFRWLVREGILLSNPASDLLLPREERRLPKAVLTEEEMERILLVPDLTTALGLRDRALLEVFYATGVRRTELARLRLSDIDRERCTLWVRQGKGQKDRVVPLGERASSWVSRYVMEGRAELACNRDDGALFLTVYGEPLVPEALTHSVRKLIVKSGVDKPGACHLFRHTMATLMLEGGADVRFVQEMLGHAHLGTTSIYTHVSIKKLQEVHAATHPGAKLRGLSYPDVLGGVDARAGA
jgi:integrase/recombinase XerD